jgi:hypothetical protein
VHTVGARGAGGRYFGAADGWNEQDVERDREYLRNGGMMGTSSPAGPGVVLYNSGRGEELGNALRSINSGRGGVNPGGGVAVNPGGAGKLGGLSGSDRQLNSALTLKISATIQNIK